MSNNSNKPNPKARGNNKSRRKKSSSKYSKTSKDDVEGDSSKTEVVNGPQMMNDPDWYFTDGVMKEGLTRLPTLEFLGQNIKLNPSVNFSADPDGTNAVSTVLKSPVLGAHYLNPSPGFSKGPTSAINMAAKKIYSKMASSNAKTANYAPQDVATLILALGEIISITTHLTRAYGVANYYNKLNRRIPKVFLDAMNYTGSVADWAREMPEFRNRLNRVITIANAITFPANIPYFKKCAYVYQHIYADKEITMSPFHMFIPYSTWILDEVTYDQGSILKTVALNNKTPFEILTILEDMIDAILASSTYNYIYADVLNLSARGVLGGELLTFATVPIDFTMDPLFSPQFNWQLKNATIYGMPNASEYVEGMDTPSNDVYPDANANTIVYMPSWSSTGSLDIRPNIQINEPIIRVPEVGVSEDDLVELLVYAGNKWVKADPNANDSAKWDVYGTIMETDIPDHYFVQSKVFGGDDFTGYITSNNTTADNPFIGIVSEFDNFPLIYGCVPVTLASGRQVPTVRSIIGHLGAFTRNMSSAITNIRYASYLSLFDFR